MAEEGSDSFITATEFQKLLSVAVIPELSPFNSVLLFSHFHVMRKKFINIVKLWELFLKVGENTKQASQTWTTSNCFRRTREGNPTNVTKLAKITSVLKIANEESEKFSKLALQTTLIVSVTNGHG